jgi:hypothetical protein
VPPRLPRGGRGHTCATWSELAHRLVSVIGQLITKNVPAMSLSELTGLVDAIRAGGDVVPRWDAVLRALNDFAAGTRSQHQLHRFWKRS